MVRPQQTSTGSKMPDFVVEIGELEERSFEEDASITNPSSTQISKCSSPQVHDQILPAQLRVDQDLEIQFTAVEILEDTAEGVVRCELDIDEWYNELQALQRDNIAQIVKDKKLQDLHNYGGVEVIAGALGSDLNMGISCPEENIKQKMPSRFKANLFTSFLGAWKNHTIILLLFSAILSLTFGIVEQGLSMIGCSDGAVVLLLMFILVLFGTTYNFFRDKRSQKKSDDFWRSTVGKMEVQVVRGGINVFVPSTALQIGDVAFLRKGARVPADGIFADGEVLELDGINTNIDDDNPFLFYGSRVIYGNARMLVTSVGMDTAWGEMLIQAMKSSENKCRLETKLHKLDKHIQIFGICVTVLVFILFLLRYKINGAKKSTPLVNTILDAIKVLFKESMFVGLLEGLPSFISVALVIWNRKTLVYKATVRDHLSSVMMASVTTICMDKFGGLSEQEKEIDKLFVGGEFVCESSTVASTVLEDLCDGIGTLLPVPPSGCESKLMLLVWWAEKKLGMKKEMVSERCKIISSNGCNPFEECCKAQIWKSGIEGKKYWHYRGPPLDILPLCSEYYNMEGNTQTIDANTMMRFTQATQNMLAEGEAIGYACRWLSESDEPSAGDQSCDLIFLGMIGLKYKNIEETKQAVKTLKEGGIRIILASRDDATLLQKVAQNYGLLNLDSDDHLVVTCEEFRAWSDEEWNNNIEKISIIGNCLPSDKLLLIKHLQEKGEVVALLGQGTADAPGLKQADIGLTLGTWSSEVARDCGDINLWDGDFSVLVDVIENGRCFYENIQKFIQLQLIITILSTLVNFTTTIALEDVALAPIELFWLNLVVASVEGLALLTIPCTEKLMEKLPVRYSAAKLLTKDMLRNIVIQASCQTSIFVTFQHIGHAILGESEYNVKSTIFNGLFLCQILNGFIATTPAKYNIFSHLNKRNTCFLLTMVLLLLCHAVFVMTERVFSHSPGLSWKVWGACLLFAFICWLLDLAGKIISSFVYICTCCFRHSIPCIELVLYFY